MVTMQHHSLKMDVVRTGRWKDGRKDENHQGHRRMLCFNTTELQSIEEDHVVDYGKLEQRW